MKNLVENLSEGKEKTVEQVEPAPPCEVENQVAEQEEKVMAVASIANLDWTPLENERLMVHGEEIMSGLIERINGLSVRTSKNNHHALSFGARAQIFLSLSLRIIYIIYAEWFFYDFGGDLSELL